MGVFFCVSLSVNAESKTQAKGVPYLQNFTPEQFGFNSKIWGIDSAPNGLVYFATDNGLLEFDGISWKNFIGSKGITRSVLVVNDSLIYTGSDLDFGVWKKDNYHNFTYVSLYPIDLELTDNYEEFWSIHQLNNSIVFQSKKAIYIYKNQSFTIVSAPSKFTGSFMISDTLYISDEKTGIYQLNDVSIINVFKYPNNTFIELIGMYKSKNNFIFVSRDDGLFIANSGKLEPIKTEFSTELKKDKVFSFAQINDHHIAFGTVLKGLFITDLEGNVIHHINRNKGLLNNTILSLHYSDYGMLWTGLDFGVSYIDLKSSLSYFIDFRGDFGSGATAILDKNTFYLGTNQGLYFCDWDQLNNDSEFNALKLIPRSEGQVWSIQKIENDLLIGHDRGLFVLKNGKLSSISSIAGVWTIVPFKNKLLVGSYNGIYLFKKENNEWLFDKQMDFISGSSNQIIVDTDKTIWVNIANYGIIKVLLDSNVNPIERKFYPIEDFESKIVFISKVKNEIRVETKSDWFVYQKESNSFKKEELLIEKNQGKGLSSSFTQSIQLNSEVDFFSVFNGFAFKSANSILNSDSLYASLLIRKMEAFNNEKTIQIYDGAEIPFTLNNINVDLLVPFQEEVTYQFKIGENGSWSTWSTNRSLNIIGLQSGDYSIKIRAKINTKHIQENSINLRVQTPWYKSIFAYISYSIAFMILCTYLIHVQKKVLEKQESRLLQQQELTLQKQAKKHEEILEQIEKVRLMEEVELIKSQLKHKTIELATKAKENEDKSQLLQAIKDKFEYLQKFSEPHKVKWGELQELLDSFIGLQDKTFEFQMDELHQEFFKKLKSKFGELSNNDLRLCAYLKAGLNSKEIADIFNIQPSSIYISRSRLRKKLNLTSEDDLFDFLNAL